MMASRRVLGDSRNRWQLWRLLLPLHEHDIVTKVAAKELKLKLAGSIVCKQTSCAPTILSITRFRDCRTAPLQIMPLG